MAGRCLPERCCIPSKALLHNAEIAQHLLTKAEDYGVSFESLQLDYSQLLSAAAKSASASPRVSLS
jgi:pyruvate/2-oxoglutarate dehydrogenase complex dihydrolipoamide dehydrogenase (E3) component